MRPNIRHRDQEIPSSCHDRPRQIRRGGIRFADGKTGFVSTAGSAKAVRVEDAEIEPRPLIFACVTKCNSEAKNLGRYFERNLDVGLVLRVCHYAL